MLKSTQYHLNLSFIPHATQCRIFAAGTENDPDRHGWRCCRLRANIHIAHGFFVEDTRHIKPRMREMSYGEATNSIDSSATPEARKGVEPLAKGLRRHSRRD